MLWNQAPRVIRHRSRVLGTPASRAILVPATPPGRDVVSCCPRRKRVRQHVVDRRADRLVDGAAGIRPGREVHRGQVAVVDVAAEHGDRGGRAALLPRRQPGEQPLELAERPAERGPVFQVKLPAHPLADAGGALAPGAAADGLVPRLQAVDAVREQQRQRSGEHHVVPVAGHRLGDPLPLRLAHHQPPALVEHPAAARVDHDDPHPRRRCAGSSTGCRRPAGRLGRRTRRARRRGHPAACICCHSSFLASSAGDRLPRC